MSVSKKKENKKYNVAVIGGGTAGLVTAAGTAGLGGRVALIERNKMGGDCLNVGCVPSKGIIRAARAVAEVRDAGEFGVHVPEGVHADFGLAMQRMRRLRARISPNDSVARFNALGVDVFIGEGRFIDGRTIAVGDRRLEFAKAVVATGARAAVPPIPGLVEAGFFTNETVWSLTELPARMAVIGAGPIGCELSQAFARFGARVSLIQDEQQILHRENRDAARIVERAMVERDGVELILGSTVESVRVEGGAKILRLAAAAGRELTVDAILIAAGRMPNVDDLGLENVGVDPATGVVSWPDPVPDPFLYTILIRATNGGGSSTQYLFLGVLEEPDACPADCGPGSGDGVVDVVDFLMVIAEWGHVGPFDCDMAPDGGDGAVNVLDVLLVLANWGTCP